MVRYRIVERTWSSNKKDYEVQKYSKKWYSNKYKWRTATYKIYYDDGMCFSKKLAIFSSEIEAERFIIENTNDIIRERVVKEYEVNLK